MPLLKRLQYARNAALALVVTIALCHPCSAQAPPVVMGGADKRVTMIGADGVETFSFVAHEGAVHSILFSRDGHRIISAGADGVVKVWNVDDGSLEQAMDTQDGPVYALALRDDQTVLASGSSDGRIRLWSPNTGKLQKTINAHSRPVRALAWSPDGTLLASGADDRVIQVWRADGTQAASIVGHDEAITGLVWSSDGRSLISGAADGYVKLWSTGDFALASRYKASDKSLSAMVGTVDGHLLATAASDGRIRVYTVTGKGLSQVITRLLEREALCLAWSSDGKVLVSGGADRALRYWKGSDLSVIMKVSASEGSITAVAVDPR